MKKMVTTAADQKRINELLDLRKQRLSKKKTTKSQDIETLVQYEIDNTVARNGMTYKQLQELNQF